MPADDLLDPGSLERALLQDALELAAAGIKVTRGDITCLAMGLAMASSNRQFIRSWKTNRTVFKKLSLVSASLAAISDEVKLSEVVGRVLRATARQPEQEKQLSLFSSTISQRTPENRRVTRA